MAGKQIHVHIHRKPVSTGKIRTKDAREEKFGIPVYTEQEVMQKIRNGEWEAETDVRKGARVEMRSGSKRFQVYVKDSAPESQDADPAKEAARKYAFAVSKIDQLSSEIEKLEDKGQTIPPQLRTQLTTFQQEVARASADVKAMAKKLGFVDADWSAKHMGNFRFEVTAPDGKKTSVQANTSAEAIAKVKSGSRDAVGESFTTLAAAQKKVAELKAAGYSNAKEKQEYDTTKPKPYPTYWIVERGEKSK